jgi:hypothetical protein
MRKSSSNRKTKRSLKGSIKRRSRRGIKSKRFRGGASTPMILVGYTPYIMMDTEAKFGVNVFKSGKNAKVKVVDGNTIKDVEVNPNKENYLPAGKETMIKLSDVLPQFNW